MKVVYDNYYQTENLFGKAYPELIDFYSKVEVKGTLLDLGCGQGRDSIPLAKMGFSVTGIDNSKVGIEQLNKIAKEQNLPLKGFVTDIYTYSDFGMYEFILLDSMFHFGKKEREKETEFLKRIIDESSPETLITICIQKSGKKVEILNSVIKDKDHLVEVHRTELLYRYEDEESNHSSISAYEMVTVRKV